MKLPLSRTRAKVAHRLKGFVFDRGGFQSMLDLRTKHQLEDSMGFRGQFDDHRRFQIEALQAFGLQPHHSFIELGCGPLTAAIPVIQYLESGLYVGVDIRSSVLDLGWPEIGKAALSAKNPRLICSAVFGDDVLAPTQTFDFIYSFSVLYHLNDQILGAYFDAVSRRLSENGACYANVNTHLPSDRWLEFPFVKRTVSDYQSLAAERGLSTSDLGTIETLGFRGRGTERLNPMLAFRKKI